MTDDKEKTLYFAMAKITTSELFYYSGIIGMGFIGGIGFLLSISILIAKLIS